MTPPYNHLIRIVHLIFFLPGKGTGSNGKAKELSSFWEDSSFCRNIT